MQVSLPKPRKMGAGANISQGRAWRVPVKTVFLALMLAIGAALFISSCKEFSQESDGLMVKPNSTFSSPPNAAEVSALRNLTIFEVPAGASTCR